MSRSLVDKANYRTFLEASRSGTMNIEQNPYINAPQPIVANVTATGNGVTRRAPVVARIQPTGSTSAAPASLYGVPAMTPVTLPIVPPNEVDYTYGDIIYTQPNCLVKHSVYLYNNGNNTLPTFNRYILVSGNCDTSSNYNVFVDVDNLDEEFPNQMLPFSYYYEVDKSSLRFECFSSWIWNLNMNVGINVVYNTPQINIYEEVYIYPHDKLIKTKELTRYNNLNVSDNITTQFTPIYGYMNQNDIFILLPDIDMCYIGQKFNFYICRKVRNNYSATCLKCCEDNTCTKPIAYQALTHQFNVNVYIFASDTMHAKNYYISDNNSFDGGLMVGPRVQHSDDRSIYYLKVDNETYYNNMQCDCPEQEVIALNPKHVFDYWKVEISVVYYRNIKRFHVDTPLPPYTNNYTTPITWIPRPCENGTYPNDSMMPMFQQ